MINRIVIVVIAFFFAHSYAQQIACSDVIKMKEILTKHNDYLGKIVNVDATAGTTTYQSTFLPAEVKRSTICIDSSAKQLSLFFYFDYFKSVDDGKKSFSIIKRTLLKCLKGYKMLKLEKSKNVIGYAFYSKNEEDYIDGESYWMLALGDIDFDSLDQPEKYSFILVYIQEW
jgi:hypothetical protein